MTPLIPNTKTPIKCEDGGPRWSLTGPLTDETCLTVGRNRYRPGWGVRTGLLAGLEQASLVVLDVDDPDGAPDWIDDVDMFPVARLRRGAAFTSIRLEQASRCGHDALPYGDVKAARAYVVLSQPDHSYRPAEGFGVGQLPLWPASILSDLLRIGHNPVGDTPAGRQVETRCPEPSAGHAQRPRDGVLRPR